jgi:hypothetical protein
VIGAAGAPIGDGSPVADTTSFNRDADSFGASATSLEPAPTVARASVVGAPSSSFEVSHEAATLGGSLDAPVAQPPHPPSSAVAPPLEPTQTPSTIVQGAAALGTTATADHAQPAATAAAAAATGVTQLGAGAAAVAAIAGGVVRAASQGVPAVRLVEERPVEANEARPSESSKAPAVAPESSAPTEPVVRSSDPAGPATMMGAPLDPDAGADMLTSPEGARLAFARGADGGPLAVPAAPGDGFAVPPPLPWTASEAIEKEMISFLGLEEFSKLGADRDEQLRTPDETVAHDDIEVVDDSEDS